MPDGIHVLQVARAPNGSSSLSVVGFDGAPARVVVAGFKVRPEYTSQSRLFSPVSPDGHWVAAAAASGQVVVLPLDGGTAQPLPGTGPNDLPIAWTPDGRRLYLLDPSGLPTRVYEVELANGNRKLWREILPIDRVGVAGVEGVVLTPDATAFAYSYRQNRSNLYLVKGLR